MMETITLVPTRALCLESTRHRVGESTRHTSEALASLASLWDSVQDIFNFCTHEMNLKITAELEVSNYFLAELL